MRAFFANLVFSLCLLPFINGQDQCPVDVLLNNSSPIYGSDQRTYLATITGPTGPRNVSYYISFNGLAIIDGDIVYGTVDELLNDSIANDIAEPFLTRRAFTDPRRAWPNANVIYKFIDADTQDRLAPRVDSATFTWRNLAPYVRFTRLSFSDIPTNGVVTITGSEGRCFSKIGFRDIPLDMNLASGCGVPETIQEFGHALGTF